MSDKPITAGVTPGRVAFALSYNGHAYHGWQAQNSGVPTVQQYLEEAASNVANEPISVVCAGRTDSSVHASHQVVHFDTNAVRSERSWVLGCNSSLPKDISVTWASQVDPTFHARFSATSRRYHYCIYNHSTRPANFADEMTWCYAPLDERLMHSAAQCLVGRHDFSSFQAAGCQSHSPVRTIEHVEIFRAGPMIIIDIKGNAFLHHMVRNIAGVLMTIGSGQAEQDWCRQVLLAQDRTKGGVTALPNGLFLSQVGYEPNFEIPCQGLGPGWLEALLCATGRNE